MEGDGQKRRGGPLVEIINDRSKKPPEEVAPEMRPGDLFRTPIEILREERGRFREPVKPVSAGDENPWKWKN